MGKGVSETTQTKEALLIFFGKGNGHRCKKKRISDYCSERRSRLRSPFMLRGGFPRLGGTDVRAEATRANGWSRRLHCRPGGERQRGRLISTASVRKEGGSVAEREVEYPSLFRRKEGRTATFHVGPPAAAEARRRLSRWWGRGGIPGITCTQPKEAFGEERRAFTPMSPSKRKEVGCCRGHTETMLIT